MFMPVFYNFCIFSTFRNRPTFMPIDITAFQKYLLYLKLVAYSSFYHEKAIIVLYRARLEVARHPSTTPRWGNPAKCFS